MKIKLTFFLSLVTLSAFAQGPILRTPYTVNTAPVVTNIIIGIVTNNAIAKTNGFGYGTSLQNATNNGTTRFGGNAKGIIDIYDTDDSQYFRLEAQSGGLTVGSADFTAGTFFGDGSQLTGIASGGAGTFNTTQFDTSGSGTNIKSGALTTNLITRGLTNLAGSTYSNSYATTRATITVPPNSAQVWHLIYPGDADAAPFSFVTTAVTNNFDPATALQAYTNSPFRGLSDVQLHYGYNLSSSPGYKSSLPIWVRGYESTWFNPAREPQMEIYDRVVLTNGALNGSDVGFGYTVGLETGRIEAAAASHILELRNPTTSLKWMDFSTDTNGQGVINIGNTPSGSGYIEFNTTNEWLISSVGVGLLGARGSNYLWVGGSGDDKMTLFKGANENGSLMTVTFGSTAAKSIRWNGTSTPHQFEYQDTFGVWHAFNEDVSSSGRRTYTIPANTTIGGTAGDYRTIGSVSNQTAFVETAIVQLDLSFSGGPDSTAQRYVVPGNYSDTSHTSWEELLPISEGHRNANKSYAVDMRYNGGKKEFRVRNVAATDLGSFSGVVTIYSISASDALWLSDVSGSGSSATVVGVSRLTPLIQTEGKVGINTNNPFTQLHVVGNQLTTGTNEAAYFKGSGLLLTDLPGGSAYYGPFTNTTTYGNAQNTNGTYNGRLFVISNATSALSLQGSAGSGNGPGINIYPNGPNGLVIGNEAGQAIMAAYTSGTIVNDVLYLGEGQNVAFRKASTSQVNLTAADDAANFAVTLKTGSGVFTNTSIATNGFSSGLNVFTRMPTNTPTDGHVITAAGTAGFTKWAASAGGSGGTNMFYVTPFDAQHRVLLGDTPNFMIAWDAGSNVVYRVDSSGNVITEGNVTAAGTMQSAGAVITALGGSGDKVIGVDNDGNVQHMNTASFSTLNVENAYLTNVYVGNFYTPTNQLASTQIDISKASQSYRTNNNIVLTGLLGVDLSNTNSQWSRIVITNSAGSGTPISCTLNGGFFDLNGAGNPFWITNKGMLYVQRSAWDGTNYTWEGR